MPHQPPLFKEDQPQTPATPNPAAGLVVSALKFGSGQVSPAQKRFNQLLSKTEALAKQIEETSQLADAHRVVATRTMAPLEKERTALMRQMVVWLDERLQRKGLSKRQKAMAREILCHLAAAVAGTGDEAMRALYATHSATTLEEEERADAADMKMFMENMFGEKLGDDDTSFDSMEDLLRANMAKMQERAAADEAARASRKANRKKSAAQLKAEARAKAQTEDATGALRTIYRQLVSALHPDRETDHAEQLRKTALMKEANAAYEKRDLLALLQLQLRADLVDASQMASMAKEKLAALTALLKDRVKVLTQELFMAEQRIMDEFNLPIYATVSATALRRHLAEQELDLREEIDIMKQDLALVQDDARFKRWLKEQHEGVQDAYFDPEDFAFD